MKKLLAILLSALMLCAMIPFGVVASAEEYTEPTAVGIVLNEDEEEVDTVNAGDTILVQVNLLNNPGVITVGVEVVYDHNVFEVPAPYDEDEEAYVPAIEVGTTYKASSNKYITFGPVDEENGVMQKCNVFYARGTATSNCDKEWFYTATFKVKDDAISGDYTLNINFTPKSGANLEKELVNFASSTTTIHVNGTEPPAGCEHEYDNDCDADCNLCGETREVAGHNYEGTETSAPTCGAAGEMTYTCSVCGDSYTEAIEATGAHSYAYDCSTNCSVCGGGEREASHSYFYPCDSVCQICYEITNPDAAHNIIAVEAVNANCTENGNTAYWYCSDCGGHWADEALTRVTNRFNVIIPATGHEYFYPCDSVCMNCYEITNPDAAHNIIAVEAVDANCTENGNTAYWYCSDCGSCWADEALTRVTNRFNVIIPATGHTYTNAHDASCDVCGEIRDFVLPASDIILQAGNSVSEERDGLAFKFDVAADGIVWNEEYIADYSNATVTIEGVEYKLVGMGAIVNNKGYAEQTLENVDDTYVLNVPAEKVFEDSKGATSYAVRIVNIPEEYLDTVITACSYYTYECEGELITVYGEDWATSYNAELG